MSRAAGISRSYCLTGLLSSGWRNAWRAYETIAFRKNDPIDVVGPLASTQRVQ